MKGWEIYYNFITKHQQIKCYPYELAIPELSEQLKDAKFIEDPIEYLCLMRLAFEKEHDGPIYQNNLASLWGFPKERINPLFFTDKTSLG